RRWLSWRLIGQREDDLLELFYLGEWPRGVPVREMLFAVDEAVTGDGYARKSARETWLPDGIHDIESSFLVPYEIRRPGPEDFREYLADTSIQLDHA
ncbi:MAG: hypothetical protein QM598_10565, partial [Protaetiibacter sp.]